MLRFSKRKIINSQKNKNDCRSHLFCHAAISLLGLMHGPNSHVLFPLFQLCLFEVRLSMGWGEQAESILLFGAKRRD